MCHTSKQPSLACLCALQTALTDPAAIAALGAIMGTSTDAVQEAVTQQLTELRELTTKAINAAVDKGPHRSVP